MRRIMQIGRVIGGFVLLLGLAGFMTAEVQAKDFTFNTPAVLSPNSSWNYSAAAVEKTTVDSMITRIEITTSSMPPGTAVDSGIAVTGPQGLAYGDVISLTGSRREEGGVISFVVDLSSTPLFVPEGYSITPVLTFYSQVQHNYTMTGKITYRPYIQGEKRYITLVLPYMDQLTLNGALPGLPNYFMSNAYFPIKVRAINAFVSFGGSVMGEKNAYMCLQWYRGSTKITEHCLPPHYYPSNGHYQSQAPTTLSWDLDVGDTLQAVSSGDAQDIQLNVIIEVPPYISNSPNLVMSDFGHVNPNILKQYCTENLQYYGNLQAKLAQCLALYVPYNKPGDLNADGTVNVLDLNVAIKFFGSPFNITDYNKVLQNYN